MGLINKFLTFFIIFLQIACLHLDKENQSNTNNDKSNVQNICSPVSEETALLIAQGYMFKDYEMRDFEPRVETENELFKEYGEMWKVSFISKTKNTFGDPVVWISKADGKVLTVKHAK